MTMEPKNSFSIVQPAFQPSKYECILMTQLRNQASSTEKFREAANRLTELLVHRVVEQLPTHTVFFKSPLKEFQGEVLVGGVELVSVMRSGDALLDTFS